jgi:UDP-2,3-diacylglucosamine pyrophosphatase LpxH
MMRTLEALRPRQIGPVGGRMRALFLSDVHLATRACRADALLEFLRCHDAETIYLVGDIVDFWGVRRGAIWPRSHNDIVQAFLTKIDNGTRVVLIPGNHDEGLRDFCGFFLSGVEIVHDCIHKTARGQRMLVTHGDEFDGVVRHGRWLAYLGGLGEALTRCFNSPLHWVRRKFGFGLWSLSGCIKVKVKAAVNFVDAFEEALVAEARRRGVDGVICGHVHQAAHHEIDNLEYLNCGDWVESCTAIAEDWAGRLYHINWLEASRWRELAAAPAQPMREAA